MGQPQLFLPIPSHPIPLSPLQDLPNPALHQVFPGLWQGVRLGTVGWRMHRSPQVGLQAECSHRAVAPVLASCLPLGKHHLQLREALMAVGTPRLCHHPDPSAWAFPGSAASWPRPLYPPEVCTLPINSANNCSWLWAMGVGGWGCILQLSDSVASLTSGKFHLLLCGQEPALSQQQSKHPHGSVRQLLCRLAEVP